MIHRYLKNNRLLNFCCAPATSATSSKAFSVFLLRPLTVLMKQTRQAVRAIKQSILLRCLWYDLGVCPRSNLLHEVQSRVGFQLLLEPLHGRDPSLFNQFRPGFDLGIGLRGRPIGGRHSRQFGRVDGDPPFVDGSFSFQTCWHFDLGQEKSHTLWASAGLKVYLHVRFQCPILRSNAIWTWIYLHGQTSANRTKRGPSFLL